MADDEKSNVVPISGNMPVLTPDQIAMMHGDSGKQVFTAREMMIPVLKIANVTSDVMQTGTPTYREEAKQGMLYDSLTFNFYTPPINLIVVRFETNYIESLPKMGKTVKLWRTDRRGYDAAEGGDVGVRVTGSGNEIREVGLYYSLVIKPGGMTLPCLMYLGSTAWREARRLNAMLGTEEIMGPNGPFIPPPYARTFKVHTARAGEGQRTWMTWRFDPIGYTLAQESGQYYYQRAKDLEEAIDKNLVKIHEEMSSEGVTGGARPARDTGSVGPQDDVPPPSGEDDYGGQASGPAQKAKDAPF